MRKNKTEILVWLAPLLFVWAGNVGAVQEEKEWMPDFSDQEKEMSPEEAMKLLKEAQKLMGSSAELLQNSSRGKALEADRELLKKLEKLLEADLLNKHQIIKNKSTVKYKMNFCCP